MPSIKFSYIFDEEIERVFDCFKNAQLNVGVVFENFVSNLKFLKGENFDEENCEFSFFWKKYYDIKMITENVINLPDYKTFTIKSTSIDKICLQIAIIFQFFQDSVDNKTIFLYEVKYEDEFFADLIKSEIKNEDVNQICINVEKYLNSIIKGLDIYNSILINQPFEIVWNIISSPKNFFNVTNKDLLVKMQEDDIIMNSISTLFEKTEDNKLNPIIKLRTEGLNVRGFVRKGNKYASELEKTEAEVYQGDLFNLEDLRNALDGVNKVYFSMSLNPYYVDACALMIEACLQQGHIEHFVNTSDYELDYMTYENMSSREKKTNIIPYIKDWSPQQRAHFICEKMLEHSGLNVTNVRATMFVENPIISMLPLQGLSE